MAVIKVYSRINWLNKSESLTTPLGKTNLNKMDKAINLIDDEVVSMSAKVDEIDTTKVSADQLNNMVTDVSFNDKNGVISITKHNGTVLNIDTAMEKIAVNFEYNAQTQQLILTLENGEKQYIDMSALITQYEFKDTDTIAFSVDSDGKVSASIKSGSITKTMLSSEVMSAITLSENNAATSAQAAVQSATNADMDAKLAQSYSVGKSGIREGEDTDNAKYYYEQSKTNADTAVQSATNAATSESNANSYMESARQSADIAVQSAESAANSEGVAAEKASEAEQSATNAKQSETNIKKAEESSNTMAQTARSYAVGDTDFRENEATDNAKYYSDKAKEYAEQAQAVAGGDFISNTEKGIAGGVAVLNDALAVEKAVSDKNGNDISETYAEKTEVPLLIKVDGSTITKDKDGILHGSTSIDIDSELSDTSTNPVENSVITKELNKKADSKDIPTSLPANGGNADTVNGHTVKSDVPENAVFTDTTYPISYKTINASFLNSFRTQTKGNTTTGDYISTIRSETSVDGAGAYGSGLAFGRGDTHGYLYVDYNTANAYLGGGNANLLKWHKKISFSDHVHTTVNGHTVNSDVPANAKFTDTVYTLPIASNTVLGGVKTGSNIKNDDGVISISKENVVAALGYTPAQRTGAVSGVKGSAESSYRTGNVNITAENVRAANKIVFDSATNYLKLYSGSTLLSKISLKTQTIATWEKGTDAEIADMLTAHYKGQIKVSDYWSVGDTRKVNLSNGEWVELVIIGFDADTLTNSINGKTRAAVTWQQKNCLANARFMSSSSSEYRWPYTDLRTWLRDTYYGYLPTKFKSLIKTVNKKSSHTLSTPNPGATPGVLDSQDTIFIPSYGELFSSNVATLDGTTVYEFYKVASNTSKNIVYWTRTGYVYATTSDIHYGFFGSNKQNHSATYTQGVAPAGCL